MTSNLQYRYVTKDVALPIPGQLGFVLPATERIIGVLPNHFDSTTFRVLVEELVAEDEGARV